MKRKLLILVALALCLSLTVFAAEEYACVIDAADVVTTDQWTQLKQQAEDAAASGCGVYIIALEDYRDYASSPRSAAEELYTACGYGVGADADGVLLLLSMDDRDYAIVGHGPLGRAAVDWVDDEAFLDDFRYDDWCGGFEDYITECGYAIGQAKLYADVYTDIGGVDGPQAVITPEPMPVGVGSLDGGTFLLIILGSAVISLIVCLVLLSQMKTARKQTAADDYVPDRGVAFRTRTDLYTHTTRRVQHVPKNNSSSGGSRGGGGGGFSGRSGKF